MSKRQTKIKKDFFKKKWASHLGRFQFSGYSLVWEINSQNPENVLDLGCGDNYFKGLIDNITGIDLANEKADMVCDIMDIELDGQAAFDIILALGSINFGSEKDILANLAKVSELIKPGGKLYMRVNPGIRHELCKDLIVFPWSIQNIDSIGLQAGFKRISPIREEHAKRLFFIYKKI